MVNIGYVLLTIANSLLLWAGMILLFSALFKWLWNTIIIRIFTIRDITYWESLRLMVMAALIFGNGPGFNLNF